jgi:hypothetical protein
MSEMPWPKDDLLHSLRRQRQTVEAGITISNCKECNGTGQCRCDVCGGIGEIEAVQPRRSENYASFARQMIPF